MNRCNVLSYADHSPSCYGTPLPAPGTKCRRSGVDAAASLEMGMPLLKGRGQQPRCHGLSGLSPSRPRQQPESQQPLPRAVCSGQEPLT